MNKNLNVSVDVQLHHQLTSHIMLWSPNKIISHSVIPIIEILIAQIIQSKVLFLKFLVLPLQAYLGRILLMPTHLLVASLIKLSVMVWIMVDTDLIMVTIIISLANHAIVDAIKYVNKKVILLTITIIIIFALIQIIVTIYLFNLLEFMSLIHQLPQKLLLFVSLLFGLVTRM